MDAGRTIFATVRSADSGMSPVARRPVQDAPPAEAPDTPVDATVAYRRQARRLRHQYANQPLLLHARLLHLARQQDVFSAQPEPSRPREMREAVSSTNDILPRAGQIDGGEIQSPFAQAVVDWFGHRVAEEVDGRLLSYSSRQSLIATAGRLGIGRFDANLMIAVAQHRARVSRAELASELRALPGWVWFVLGFVQAGIVGLGWMLLRGV